MTEAIMVYSAVMRAQLDKLNSVAQNTSNANSTGYLHESSFINSNSFLNLLSSADANAALSNSRATSLGALKLTNSPLDLALASDHWFVLESEGTNLITRNGAFSVSSEGYLMLGEHRVMGMSGPIQQISRDAVVHADGSIYLNGELLNKLKIVSISSGNGLLSYGDGIYRSDEVQDASESPKVVQGALVNSNVDLESDMTKVIETTRHIEMLQRAMSAYDDMMDVGINQLGK